MTTPTPGATRAAKVEPGAKFGRLTAVHVCDRDRNRGAIWFLVCECGNTTKVRSASLRSGATRSCGCLYRESRKTCGGAYNKLPPGEAGHNQTFTALRSNARRRKIGFELTREQHRELSTKPCKYCGSDKTNIFRRKHLSTGGCSFTGLDRDDNNIGYTFENTVPCCPSCNSGKGQGSAAEFIARCDRVSARHGAVAELLETLDEARIQLEYLDAKFMPTGTTAQMVARIDALLAAHKQHRQKI